MENIKGHLVNTKTNEWYHYDDRGFLYTCGCMNKDKVSLCITIADDLLKEGELRELDRQIADRRKQLGFLMSETLEEGYKRLLDNK